MAHGSVASSRLRKHTRERLLTPLIPNTSTVLNGSSDSSWRYAQNATANFTSLAASGEMNNSTNATQQLPLNGYNDTLVNVPTAAPTALPVMGVQVSRNVSCGDYGSPAQNNTCICDDGYGGDQCQFSDLVTCSGHGSVRKDGTCQCVPSSRGAHCEFSHLSTCNGNGAVDSTGRCACLASAGSHCEFTNDVACR